MNTYELFPFATLVYDVQWIVQVTVKLNRHGLFLDDGPPVIVTNQGRVGGGKGVFPLNWN